MPSKNTFKTLNRHGLIAGATGTGKQNHSSLCSNFPLLNTNIDDGHKRTLVVLQREVSKSLLLRSVMLK
jgi:hypothetical protein